MTTEPDATGTTHEEPAKALRPNSKHIFEICESHSSWLRSDGKVGERAHFVGFVLDGFDFTGLSLANADFRQASLREANLKEVDLSKADFTNADLTRCDLTFCQLEGCSFRHTILRHTNFTRAEGLVPEQFGGADLSGAVVPDGFFSRESFDEMFETMRNARTVLLVTLIACAYTLLAVFDTNDVELIMNTRELLLPILQAEVPVVGFFVATPLILFLIFSYFHVRVISIFQRLSRLPRAC